MLMTTMMSAGDRVALDELATRRPSRRRSRPPRDDLARDARAPASSSIRPAFRSASIAICLPGIASSVKRAPTSATRPAPFVTTTNWMTIRIRKTTRPTTSCRRRRTRRTASMTGLPRRRRSSRISRVVEATLSARRNSVASSSRVGNDRELERLAEHRRPPSISTASAMLNVSRTSSSGGGSGTTIIITTITTESAASMSVCSSSLRWSLSITTPQPLPARPAIR